MAITITPQAKRFFLADQVREDKAEFTKITPEADTGKVTFRRNTHGSPVFYKAHYSDCIDGDTGLAFTSLNALLAKIDVNFSKPPAQTGAAGGSSAAGKKVDITAADGYAVLLWTSELQEAFPNGFTDIAWYEVTGTNFKKSDNQNFFTTDSGASWKLFVGSGTTTYQARIK